MNLILKDIELIRIVSDVGTNNSLFPRNSKLWVSQLTDLDLDFITSHKVRCLAEKDEINIYTFSEYELEMAFDIYRQYSENITFSNAAIIVAAKKVKNASVVVSDKIFCEICKQEKIKIYENIRK